MLAQLESLKRIHNTSTVTHTQFQPNEEGQRKLIIKGITHRMISLALKRESTKHLYAQKLKLDDLQIKLHSSIDTSALDTTATNTNSLSNSTYRIIAKPIRWTGRRPPKLSKRGSTSAFQDVLDVFSPTLVFSRILKDCKDSNRIVTELNLLALSLAKDSKRVFDSICRGYDLGRVFQLNPKRLCEDIDLSDYSLGNLLNVTKLEDLNKRKRDGILIIFDPSTNTLGEKISLKITYTKYLDLNVEEEVCKEYYFSSNGNYFGLTLQKEAVRAASPSQMNHEMFAEENDRTRHILPGWHGKNPIYIPAIKCKLELIGLDAYSNNALLINNITRLKFYCAFSSGMKMGMRRISEFLEKYSLQDAANLLLPGGMSCLNYACLHGNFEAVQRLVLCGAGINHRCKPDNHCTPLHEAVVGRNVQIVSFLIESGANQLLKDDHGNCPLHYACKIGDVAIVRILLENVSGRRALLVLNNLEQKPIDVCSSNYIRSQVEVVMRRHRIFVAPRISILDRT